MGQAVVDILAYGLASSLGFNFLFWSLIGALRFVSERGAPHRPRPSMRLEVKDVAVVIPARNEELALPRCLAALISVIPPAQIYVASDGSSDRTVAIARAMNCNVIDIQPNGGKAQALARAIAHYDLCDVYGAVLIQDADSEIDVHYLEQALPLFDDSEVVVVAGHALSRWGAAGWRATIFTAYRTRLYRIVQLVFQYGQSWKHAGVSYIAPGFASMYRCSALKKINIAAPGLVIEDFNMTFEVQHKRLGRIAYSTRARCSCEDPHTLADYTKQLKRWYLGLWQTIWRHGVWRGKFWAALAPFLAEVIVLSVFALALPIFALFHVVAGNDMPALTWGLSVRAVSPEYLLVAFLLVDYAITILVAILDRRPSLLVFGFVFPALRLLEAGLFLDAFARSLFVKSDGLWTSPLRTGRAGVSATVRSEGRES